MASGKLSVFSLGHSGVIIDQNSLEPTLPDDSLQLAQNAMHDPQQGHAGGLRKRPGLQRFNGMNADGVIMGGIMMPVAETGGAPASGGGALLGTSSSNDTPQPGTGDATGAPGATWDGGPAATTPPGAGQFNGGSPVFGGARLFVTGRLGSDDTVGQEGGSGWYVSSKGLADVSTLQIPPGPPIAVYDFPPTAEFPVAWGTPSCIDNIGTTGLYFSAFRGDQTVGALASRPETLAQIRNTNGATDSLIARIPPNSSGVNGGLEAGINTPNRGVIAFTIVTGGSGYIAGQVVSFSGGTGTNAQLTVGAGGVINSQTEISNEGSYSVLPTNPITLSGGSGACTINATFGPTAQRQAIMALHYGMDGFIYVAVKDKYNGQNTAGNVGRVLRLSPLNGALVEWNLGPDEGPAELFTHLPYCLNYFDGRLYVGTFPAVINESASIWSSNGSNAVAELSFAFSGHTQAYGFLSCMAQYNGRLWLGTGVWETSPVFSMLWSRRPGPLFVDAISAWDGSTLVGSGGAAANGNYFTSMVVFGDALYAQFFNPSGPTAKVYKIVANDPGNPLSVSFTVTTSLAAMNGVPHYLFVDDGVLYAIGSNGGASSSSAWVTTDGVTWTEKTASFPATLSSSIRPIFFGMNQ